MAVHRVMRAAPLWLAAVWLMSLTTLGFMVVPLLFTYLPTPAMAGSMAAHLFSAQAVVSAASTLLLVMLLRTEKHAVPATVTPIVTMLALAGALLALLVEFGVAPRIVLRENLRLWHSLGSAMLLLQWCCALWVFGKLASMSQEPADAHQAHQV